ncbi:hypothetical protein BDZ89DRAFT_1055972 [Hymenopellis radicata]|nr:hypothetical protein BDZ89DRAFT_1055972 [Hymenopellis radicata]
MSENSDGDRDRQRVISPQTLLRPDKGDGLNTSSGKVARENANRVKMLHTALMRYSMV